jgi:hypothetical protein
VLIETKPTRLEQKLGVDYKRGRNGISIEEVGRRRRKKKRR